MKTIKKLSVTLALKSMLVVLLLSWIAIMSSCTMMRPSRYDSNGVMVVSTGRSDRQLRKNDRNDRRNDRNGRKNDRSSRNNSVIIIPNNR